MILILKKKLKLFFYNLRYFKTQILLSFSSLIILTVAWFMSYLYIENKVEYLNDFSYKSYKISQEFSANKVNFQTFLLFGYKEDLFYKNQNQKSLKLYIDNIKKQKKEVDLVLKESNELNIGNYQSLNTLSKEIDNLFAVVNDFKKTALIRGFKNHGIEGQMRLKAHFLEKKSLLNKSVLLQFRRHEKDFMLRSDSTSIKKFEDLYDSILKEENNNKLTLEILTEYKNDFDSLVRLSSKLGYSQDQGLYGEINQINNAVENLFGKIIYKNENRITNLKNDLFYFQLSITLITIIISLILIVFISNYFTKDIKLLTIDISNYIKSNFKESNISLNHKPNIREIDFLFKSYGILKERLSENISYFEKNTEQANKIAAFKTQFLANMSHEIRSPLNGVMGMLNMLKASPLNTEQNEHIEIAEHSAAHLLGIVNMILDHSKIEAGKMKVEEYPIHLKKELTKLIRLFEYRINDKDIKMKFIYDDAINNDIIGDNLRLQQVLINLLDNAIKFTNQGSVILEVYLYKFIDNLQYINFKITDSGIGIDSERTEQMLQAFEQADLSTTRKYGGTGLGLTISNQLVQLMGGSKLTILSLETGGSSFSFEIPFKINENVVSIKDNDQGELNITKDLIINKALIVEDNLINQKVLHKLLDKINIPADIAINGLEAVSLYYENEYDIIFMDLHMPEMDGFEATEKIHSSEKYKLNAIPIIAVTASAFDEDKTKAISKGMDDFITKPVVLKNLEEIIAKQMHLKCFQYKNCCTDN